MKHVSCLASIYKNILNVALLVIFLRKRCYLHAHFLGIVIRSKTRVKFPWVTRLSPQKADESSASIPWGKVHLEAYSKRKSLFQFYSALYYIAFCPSINNYILHPWQGRGKQTEKYEELCPESSFPMVKEAWNDDNSLFKEV